MGFSAEDVDEKSDKSIENNLPVLVQKLDVLCKAEKNWSNMLDDIQFIKECLRGCGGQGEGINYSCLLKKFAKISRKREERTPYYTET